MQPSAADARRKCTNVNEPLDRTTESCCKFWDQCKTKLMVLPTYVRLCHLIGVRYSVLANYEREAFEI